MYLKCAHPDCSSDFDFGQGRLYRFQQSPQQARQPAHWHAVKHYWLCARCCESYTIEYHKGAGVVLMERLETLGDSKPSYYVLHPESAPKPVLPRRVARSRARQKVQRGELTPVPESSIEVLETRNVERRGLLQ
jgi:hypothetical protein